jgi:tRNA 5-methylaminomethyl-2-thiouridine biosynthesis bifunctional protein
VDNPATGELALCGLPQAWPGLPAWTVLDAGMQGARRFLHTWLAWQSDLRRPRLLHYVAISPTASHWLAEADALPSHAQPKGWQACARQC